ncbi:10801_t:CDS:2 [Ambispora leptoticha]|uniref:10801_t:CDS:1 n=1 Tax=Ambispora leptoticha TaxID=144679 RepID=A0A9N8VZ99_9GLOM|nr:10801_t:CDS:2 [Ambispora leptoticha]
MRIIQPYLLISLYCAGIWRVSTASATLPEVKFERVSQVGIAGQYSGISLASQRSINQTIDVNSASLFRLISTYNGSGGDFQLVGSTSKGGTITALCQLPRNNNSKQYDIYVGGNFTSMASKSINNIARYDPDQQTFSSLLDGLDGPVSSLYCDSNTGSVYVGGSFTAPVNAASHNINVTSFGGSIAVWKDSTWQALPFKGFNGPVLTIAYNLDNNTFYFGGVFDATANGDYGATSSLQPINLQKALITSGNSGIMQGFNDPTVLICSGNADAQNNTWLMNDNIPGFWRAEFNQITITPTSIGIKNTAFEGRGTKTFRLLSVPDNAVLNLSYVDPSTNAANYCTDACPLTHDSNQYQMFNIVDPHPLNGIQIDIREWYGNGGGLHGIQLYQSEVVVKAAGDSGFPKCSNTPFSPTVTPVGPWTSQVLNGVWETVLVASIPTSQLSNSNVSVTLQPYVPQTGFYDVTYTSQSCLPIGCDKTIPIKVTLNYAPGLSISQIIPQDQTQTNISTIYSGTVVATTSSFAPSVVVSIPQSVTPPSGGVAVIAVDLVKFVKRNSSTPLSGLFQYNPSTNSAPTWGGFNNVLSQRANITTIAVYQKSLIVIGGSFTTTSYSNIVFYDGSNFISLANNGLNGPVNTITIINDNLLIGGAFNGTASQSDVTNLNNLAKYDIKNKRWLPIGVGVNGQVQTLSRVNTSSSKVFVSGQFNTVINPKEGNLTYGLPLWDDTLQDWSSAGYVEGTISSILPNVYPGGTNSTTYFGGNILDVQSLAALGGGLVTANPLKLSALPISPQSNGTIPQFSLNTGVFWNDSVIIVGGDFEMAENIQNVAIEQQNGSWTGLGSNLTINGTVNNLYIDNNILYIGGKFVITTDDKTMYGFALYDLNKKQLVEIQPPQLTENGNGNEVSVKVTRSRSQTILVAGTFDKAGSLDCQAICEWDLTLKQWNNVCINSELSGNVYWMDLDEQQEILVIGGDLKLNGTKSYLLKYEFGTNIWQPLGTNNSGQNLPGPVKAITIQSQTVIFISGVFASDNTTTYLRKWDGKKFIEIGNNKLNSNSTVNQLQIVPMQTTHNSNGILDDNFMLLVSGSLSLEDYGNVSTALFDGEVFYPYIYSSQTGGLPGNILSIFFSNNFDFNPRKFLAVPLVILVSISIALALTFLIVAIGRLIMEINRKKSSTNIPQNPRNSMLSTKSFTEINQALIASNMYNTADLRNSELKSSEKPLDELATAGVVSVAAAGGITQSQPGHDLSLEPENAQQIPPTSNVSEGERDSETSDMMPSTYMAEDTASGSIDATGGSSTGGGAFHEIFLNGGPEVYYAKYHFEARESAELGFEVGDKIHVIDKNDPIWWMGLLDNGTGRPRQGVFPSNYVTLDPPPYDHDEMLENQPPSQD